MYFFHQAKVFILSLGLLAAAKPAFACSVCFTSVEDDPQSIALKWSVLTLLAIVLMVLGFVAKFCFTLAKREKELLQGSLGK